MSQKTQKIFAIILLIFLLAAIPLTVWFGAKQQNTQQKAAFQVPGQQQYACGPSLTVLLTPLPESPSCTQNSGTVPGLTSFQSSITVRAKSGSQGAYNVHWMWVQFWCPTEDPHAPCYDNMTVRQDKTPSEQGLTGDNKAYVTAVSDVRTPTAGFSACGYYQNDFGFAVYDNNKPGVMLCGVTMDANTIAHSTNNNASWCHSGVTCATTSTPTPTQAITPTDTPIPTDTPVPTGTPTPTDTPTPTSTPAPSDTPIPTGTPTPTGTIAPTPTPTVVVFTPTSTPIPTIIAVKPKPTLPPTGPGSLMLSIGFFGVVFAAVGAVILLAL